MNRDFVEGEELAKPVSVGEAFQAEETARARTQSQKCKDARVSYSE